MNNSLTHIRLRQEAIMRKRRRSKAIVKSRHKLKRRHSPQPIVRHTWNRPYIKPIEFVALSSDFRILSNANVVIKGLDKISTVRGKRSDIRLLIDMTNVNYFDLGSLTCLLSTLRFCKNYYGNEPINPSCKKYFEESGFLNWMRDLNGRKFIQTSSNNLIFEKGTDKTSNRKVGEEIRKAIKYLTKQEGTFPPVYSIIQEICPNSIEHANKQTGHKNWMMGIRYESDKVCFAMCDKGSGILKTLKRKNASQYIGDKFNDDITILHRAFEKKYQSATADDNRNKGLPRIKAVSDEGFINNLTVITNKTLLNLSDNAQSRQLGSNFAGTFYYSEITRESYYKWKQRKQSISA